MLLDALLTQVGSQKVLTAIFHHLQETQNLQLSDVIRLFQESSHQISVPLSLFKGKVHPTAVLCKYLKQEKKLSHQEIGALLNRDQRSVWTACKRAKKYTISTHEKYHIPLSLFKNRSLSILEHIVLFLHHTYKLSNKDIATLLNKSANSIAVLHKRAREKNE